VEKDCKVRGLNREDAMDRSRWKKQIGIFDDHDGCEWVNVFFFWYRLTRVVPDKIQRAVKRLCVCVLCVCVPGMSPSCNYIQLNSVMRYRYISDLNLFWLHFQEFSEVCIFLLFLKANPHAILFLASSPA